MSLHASSNGGALAEWQEAAHQEVHVAATAFLPGSKAVCALASAQACTVCSVPWLQAQSGVISRYICPEVQPCALASEAHGRLPTHI